MKKSIELLGKCHKNQKLVAIILLIRDIASRYCSNFGHSLILSIKGKMKMMKKIEYLIVGRGPSKFGCPRPMALQKLYKN